MTEIKKFGRIKSPESKSKIKINYLTPEQVKKIYPEYKPTPDPEGKKLPDLRLVKFELFPRYPLAGETLHPECFVVNSGTKESGEFFIALKTPIQTLITVNIKNLKPGEGVAVRDYGYFATDYGASWTYRVSTKVDQFERVRELVEANNEINIDVTTMPATPPPAHPKKIK